MDSQQSSQAVLVYNPSLVRPDDVRSVVKENVYVDRLCEVCRCDTDHRIYHHHVSTQNIRNFAKTYQK